MPSADQVPVNSTHSMMRWHKWVVLIAGSTGSALRAVCPFQPSHHAGWPTRSRLCRKRDGFPVSLAPGHHGPDHAGDLVGKRDGSDLGRPPRQQCGEPGPMLGAVDLGIADDMRRQRVLERVGWRFWRCWASSFTIAPDECMADLFATLDRSDI